MKHLRILSLALVLALLVSSVGFAEMEPAAPEAPVAADAVDAEPEVAETLVIDEPATTEAKAGVPVVALTGSKASAQMNVGDTLQIGVNPGETGTFTSKSKKLAVVDAGGLVTALAKGTVKIEFKPSGGKKRTLTVKIIDIYEPTGVSIAQGKSITMNVGDVLKLNAALTPGTARTTLTWKSDKSKIASVDRNGAVTALSKGKAKITVTTANKKKASISVTVNDPYRPTGVRIGQGSEVAMNVGDRLQLNAVLAPQGARTTLTWKSSKSKVASVDKGGVVTALTEGKAKITVTTANSKKATIAVKVVNANKPSGVSINEGSSLSMKVGESAQLTAAVAPATARTTLSWKSSKTKVARVDATGRVTAMGKGKAKITVTTDNGISDALEVQVSEAPIVRPSPAMLTASYNGTSFKVVNTAIDPVTYAGLVYDNVCTHPGGTDKYEGYCLCFCNYYVSGMVDNLAEADPSKAKRDYRTSKKLSYRSESVV